MQFVLAPDRTRRGTVYTWLLYVDRTSTVRYSCTRRRSIPELDLSHRGGEDQQRPVGCFSSLL
eukprot:COSAG03_NODE_1089_length_4848_cov_3.105706_3_plen_62_part_01